MVIQGFFLPFYNKIILVANMKIKMQYASCLCLVGIL